MHQKHIVVIVVVFSRAQRFLVPVLSENVPHIKKPKVFQVIVIFVCNKLAYSPVVAIYKYFKAVGIHGEEYIHNTKILVGMLFSKT